MHNLIEQIQEAGIENCLFMVPMRPLHTYFGVIALRNNNDPEVIVPMRITEERFPVSKNYKIGLKCDYELFGHESFYVSDLESLIRDGRVKFYINANAKTLQE